MLKERRFFIMFFSIILFIIAVLPSVIGKFLFAPTGSLKIIGPVIGFFLAFGIYYKWQHIEKIFYFIFGLTIMGDFLILTKSTGEMLLFILFLSLCHILLLILFSTSQTIRTHLGLKNKF
jgi:hypothetical protein